VPYFLPTLLPGSVLQNHGRCFLQAQSSCTLFCCFPQNCQFFSNMRNLKRMQNAYVLERHPAEEGEKGFWVSVPALPGCFSQGKTYEEAVENAREAILCYLETLAKHGEKVPEEI
jgi:antitoxin HicB